jgi:hypothetical protein
MANAIAPIPKTLGDYVRTIDPAVIGSEQLSRAVSWLRNSCAIGSGTDMTRNPIPYLYKEQPTPPAAPNYGGFCKH